MECEVESVKRGVASASAECGVEIVKCGVWGVIAQWLRSVKCGVWSVECEVESVHCGVRSVKCGVESVKCEVGVWSGECEVWCGKCGVGSVKCGVWSLECEVWSVECDVGSEECGVECGVWSVKRGVESVKCEVWSGDCEVARVECVKCGVWSLMWEVWNVKRGVGVWRAECEVWGASLNSLCAVRHLIQYSPCREPNFCVVSKRNWSGGLASSPICHLLASLLFSPFFLLVVAWGAHFGLAALVPKLSPMCFYAVCVSPFVCLITALCILLSFLWLLWDEGFLVFPIPPLRDRPGSVFFPTGLPTWLSICLPSCGGFATEEFLRLSCFERYHSLSLMAAMLLTCHLIVIIGCRVSNMFSAK